MLPRPLPERGPILLYLSRLFASERREDKDAHDMAVQAVRAALSGDAGRILLELLEVSINSGPMPAATETRALGERNAQEFILSDLRRLLTNEPEQLAQRQADASSARRPGGNNPRR